MSLPTPPDTQGAATRPYLIRALHEWCTDNGFTPYLAVHVDDKVLVPTEFVKDNEIVLNVGFDATQGLKLGNEVIEFRARFGGVAREIAVPVDHVIAIYARENGQGMAFPSPSPRVAGASVAQLTKPARAAPPEDAVRAPPALRLATPKPDREPERAGAEVDRAPGAREDSGDEPPPEPSPPPVRPALKRIK